MVTVAVRDLRNNTAKVIQQIRQGETVVLTSRGEKIGQIQPIPDRHRPYLTPVEVMSVPKTDAGLRQDLMEFALDSTDELGPIQ